MKLALQILPFVWRVDLKTGKKKCVLHWDKDKIRTSEIGVDGDDS